MTDFQDQERTLTAGREEIAAILHDVADGVRAGAVRVGGDGDSVTVDVPDELDLEIELESAGEDRSLELELEWSVAGDGSDGRAVEESQEGEANADVSPGEGSGVDDGSGDVSAVANSPEGGDGVAPVGSTFASRPLARFEVYEDRAGEFRWRLRHRNGNVIATAGEGYTRKHNAVKSIRGVVAGSADASITGEFGE